MHFIACCTCRSLSSSTIHLGRLEFGAAMVHRAYQDYSSWISYGTDSWWQDVENHPHLAGELAAQRLSALGLVNASEKCIADIVSVILVAMHGPTVSALFTNTQIEPTFVWLKARPRMHASIYSSARL